jgi:carboxyl-terminal processing protease
MKRPHRRVVVLLVGAVVAMAVLLAGIWLGGHPSDLPSLLRGSPFESRRNQTVTEQALNILTTRYYRPLNRSSLVDVGLSGMVASLDDRYSHYLDPRAYRARSEPPTQPPVGIGINVVAEPAGLRVVRVLEHSPAARAGLLPGDLIIKVGSTSLADRSEDFGSELIRGPAGTQVRLTFTRDDHQHVISVERAPIVVPVATWQMLVHQRVRIGYLKLTGFAEGAGDKLRADVRAALDAHAQALILDLRGNGGGLISEAINVASAFIARGEIMSAEERGRPRRVYMARGDAIAAEIPLVVLVDHGTASSAEIVTGALQDHGRAKVVGTQTYGKGVFQITERLINGGALDITIGQFFTPDGRNLGGGGARQGAGITPNVYASDNSTTPNEGILAVGERTVAAEVQ